MFMTRSTNPLIIIISIIIIVIKTNPDANPNSNTTNRANPKPTGDFNSAARPVAF